jgi:S-phase kinase-associated protein 1
MHIIGMDEDEEEVVPLPNVNSAILKKVIQWATYHKDDPPPPEDDENKEKRTDDISSWDADFLKVDQGTLFELILVCELCYVSLTDVQIIVLLLGRSITVK